MRRQLRNVLALAGLIAIGLTATFVLLQEQRLRIPILEEKPFQLKAEFESAQAITPGQGQTVVVAGVRIGDISDVELEDGVAVVTMDIERKFLPIYRNATALVRPRSGLQDMFIELDPGGRSAGRFEDGGTIPLARTSPQVNLDEILGALDFDTRNYLRLLLVGGGQALNGRGTELGGLIGNLGPINGQLARLNSVVAQRRANLAHLVNRLNVLSEAVGSQSEDLTRLVDNGSTALAAIAGEGDAVERSVSLLPDTLRGARSALARVTLLARRLGPTFNHLRPFARNLDEVSGSLRELSATTPAIGEQIRPFVRTARPVVEDLRPAAVSLTAAAPDLTVVGRQVNRLSNMVAYNPRGAEPLFAPGRDEGYLYWSAWLFHIGNYLFSTQDANGPFWRVYLTFTCQSALSLLGTSPLAPVVTGLGSLFAPGAPFAGGCN